MSAQEKTTNLSSDSTPRLNRKYPRRKIARPVGVLLHGKYFLCSALDVSESGLSIDIASAANFPLALQDEILVTFKLPSSAFIVTKARVRSQKDPGQNPGQNAVDLKPMAGFTGAKVPVLKDKRTPQFALFFLELTLHQRRLIRDFVSSKLAGEEVHSIELDQD